MDIEKVLQFFADGIDGKLFVCDDGYVIESWITDRNKSGVDSGRRVDYVFSEEGRLEYAEIKKGQ
jgi:hypothetical protein